MPPKRQYREGSRASRFLRIRDAILPHVPHGREVYPGVKEIAVGPFLVVFAVPGAWGIGRGYNLQIWPGGRVEQGVTVQKKKVANVDWNQRDEVDILSFRTDDWEEELLELLAEPNKVLFMPRG